MITDINKSSEEQFTNSFTIANSSLLERSTFFHVNRKGKEQPPLLIVTTDGIFHWAEDAEERLALDDFNDFESLRFVLLALWKQNNIASKSDIVDY